MRFYRIMIGVAAVSAVVWLGLRGGRSDSLPGTSLPESAKEPSIVAADRSVHSPILRQPVRLITGIEGTEAVWPRRTPAAKRAQKVDLDPAMMESLPVLKKGDQLELVLFDDAVFRSEVAAVTSYPNGALGITARLAGDSKGTVFLASCGGQLRVDVDVLGGADYAVRYNPETGDHCAIEVDRENSDYLESSDILAPSAPVKDLVSEDIPAAQNSATPVDAPTGSTVVDVMIVYTPAARAYEGGVSGMDNNIAMAMQRANEAHGNSDTQIYLNMVHSEEVAYSESGNASEDLKRLTYNDGIIDQVHTLRDTYGADFVCMFIKTEQVGGIGWLITDHSGYPQYAFCLARVQQSDWTYTVVHEWGHNMGCSHSKSQVIQPWRSDDFSSYSAGWQWDDAHLSYRGYCSVMTYEDVNNDGSDEYERVGYFSNPNKFYNGKAVGNAANGDNARVMREMKSVYAAYRNTALPPPPPLPPIPPPITDPVTNYPYSESFEDGYGYWSYAEGQFEWTRQTGETVTDDTGPHDAKDGNMYMYTEANDPFGQTALLRATFDFTAVSSPEIEFSYHMRGAGIGTLYVEGSTDGAVWRTLWSLSGNQGDQWVTTNINLQVYGGVPNVQIRFREVMQPFSYVYTFGDTALDLITVRQAEVSDDIDHDGLPNEWETLYFGGPTNANCAALCANGIQTVWGAYVSGVNPTDPHDVFRISEFHS